MSAEVFAIASGVLAFAGAPVYLVDILRGKTKPERTTWFIWTVQGLIAFGSQVVLGAHWSLLFIGLNAGGNLLVFLLSLKFGVGGWKRIDILALVIAATGLAVSLIARAPVVALLGVIVADFAGTVPTFFKVFRMPESETAFMWLAFATSSALAVFSVGSFKWSLIAYPLYLALDNYAVVAFQLAGRLATSVSGDRRLAQPSTKSRRRRPVRR